MNTNNTNSYKLLINLGEDQNLSSITTETVKKITEYIKIEKLNINKDDLFGLNYYSFFEKCNIDKSILLDIEKTNDLNTLLISAWIEEISVYWLQNLFNKEICPIKKMFFLKMLTDEHKHFLIIIGLIKNFYPTIDLVKEYNLIKNLDNTLSYSNPNSKEQLDYTELVFEQFKGEVFTITELKYQYKKSKCKIYKTFIKQILSDESNHVNGAKQFKNLFTDPNTKLKFKRKIYSSMRLLNKTGMRPIRYSTYKISLENYNINIGDYIKDIRQSTRSMEYVNDTYKKLYKLCQDIEIIPNMTFNEFITDSGINK